MTTSRLLFADTTFSSDINALIFDYLTLAGYPNAAAKFSTEANLSPHQHGSTIEARQEIQDYIKRGEIENAIRTLNNYDPSVCRYNYIITLLCPDLL